MPNAPKLKTAPQQKAAFLPRQMPQDKASPKQKQGGEKRGHSPAYKREQAQPTHFKYTADFTEKFSKQNDKSKGFFARKADKFVRSVVDFGLVKSGATGLVGAAGLAAAGFGIFKLVTLVGAAGGLGAFLASNPAGWAVLGVMIGIAATALAIVLYKKVLKPAWQNMKARAYAADQAIAEAELGRRGAVPAMPNKVASASQEKSDTAAPAYAPSVVVPTAAPRQEEPFYNVVAGKPETVVAAKNLPKATKGPSFHQRAVDWGSAVRSRAVPARAKTGNRAMDGFLLPEDLAGVWGQPTKAM